MPEENLERGRYRREAGKVVIDVIVNNSRQLFNERDPAPFRERDLDENFVDYILSSVREFPLREEMKLKIFVREERDHPATYAELREAIHGYFIYESRLARSKLRERMKISRWFFLVGISCLFVCLGIAQLLDSLELRYKILSIVSEGFVIVGWVAMWRPVETILYDWWPMREQRLYLDKVAAMEIDLQCGAS